MTATRNRSLARNSAVMAAGSFVSRILGVVRQAMIVMIFGRSVAGDAWSIANTLPNTVFLLLAGGVLNAVLVPQITKAQHQEDGGREYIDKLLTLALVGLGVVTLAAVPAAPWLVRLFSDSSFPARGIDLSIAFAYIALPAIFFYGLYAILGQVLNAREAFGWFSWAPVLCNVVWIAGLSSFLGLYGRRLGHPDQFTPPMVWLLAGSLTVGVALQALVLIVPLWRAGFRYRPRTGFRGVGLGSASRVAMWTFAALVVSQVGLIVQSKVLTSAVEGGNTGKLAYDSAFMLFMTPHGLITVSVVTALFTSMSKAAATKNTDSVRHDVLHGLGIVGATVIPVMAGSLALGTALTSTIFVGSSVETTNAIGYVMMVMMIGLPAHGAFYIAQRAFFAYEDAKTPFRLQLVNTAVGASIALLSYLLSAQFRAVGVAGGQALSNIFAAVVALLWLSTHLGGLSYRKSIRTWVRALVASVPAALVAAFISWAARTYLPPVLGGPADGVWLASVVALLVGGTLFVIVYASAARRMQVREIDEFVGPVLRRLRGATSRGGAGA